MGRYLGNVETSLTNLVRETAPLDIRYVLDEKADLINPASFGSITQYDILTYKGLIVAVVDDSDYNNGVYYLQGDDHTLYDSWIKLISFPSEHFGGNEIVLQWDSTINAFIWKQKETSLAELTDTEVNGVQNNYFLKWDATINKWVPAPIGGGGSGGGVTTEEIDYNMVFTPVSQGGLGYPNADAIGGELGTEGHGLGFLKPSDFNVNGVTGKIPVGTNYTDIFKAILEGEEMLRVNVVDYTVEYDAQQHNYPHTNVTVTPTGAQKYFSTSETGNYVQYANQLFGTAPTILYGYFKAFKDNRYSIAKRAKFEITKVKTILRSESADKVYNGTPLTNPTVTLTGNDPHNVFNTATAIGSITYPGSIPNDIQYSIPSAYSQFYETPTLQKGILTIYPKVEYSIDGGTTRIPVTRNTPISDTTNNALNKIITTDSNDPQHRTGDVYYIGGKSGNGRIFKIYIYGKAGIDENMIWYYDSTGAKWMRSQLNANEWKRMSKSIEYENGIPIEVWTYSYQVGTTELVVNYINLAFQVDITKNA